MFRTEIIASVLLLNVCLGGGTPLASLKGDTEWFKNSLVYQVYPRSFKDSDGDGIGDLEGITSKLEHIADIGATVVWLSPIFTSPQVDFGYDISNFTDIDRDYGTLAHFDRLVARSKSLGLKVVLDFVPNHSSHEHDWFKKSIKKIKPYDEYYVWRDAKIVNGARHPPTNWLSAFQGSAWTWNAERGQYYLHQFAAGQPDLNFRSPKLQQEMKDILTFWMKRGVEGFRIDSMTALVEDNRFLDEPKSGKPGIPDDDFESLVHIYTQNQEENYDILKSWRQLLDEYSNRTNGDLKILLTEAYTTPEYTFRYYETGSNVPFNFMFIADLNNQSSALNFKRLIDRWMNSVPKREYVANWVVGNHDNHRVASRFGVKRADQLNMLANVLPGVGVIYNGDEIGMVDRPFTYKETVDPAGCNAGPDRYHLKSRDPERTPFQWDATTSAGFSTNTKTWLPVHSNYKTLNLAVQKKAQTSHYKVFKRIMALKKMPIVAFGSNEVTLVTENALGVVRRLGLSTLALVVNFSEKDVRLDVSSWLNVPETMVVYVASKDSNVNPGGRVNTTNLYLPGAASVIYTTPDLLL